MKTIITIIALALVAGASPAKAGTPYSCYQAEYWKSQSLFIHHVIHETPSKAYDEDDLKRAIEKAKDFQAKCEKEK
jgi:hypothetical protein